MPTDLVSEAATSNSSGPGRARGNPGDGLPRAYAQAGNFPTLRSGWALKSGPGRDPKQIIRLPHLTMAYYGASVPGDRAAPSVIARGIVTNVPLNVSCQMIRGGKRAGLAPPQNEFDVRQFRHAVALGQAAQSCHLDGFR